MDLDFAGVVEVLGLDFVLRVEVRPVFKNMDLVLGTTAFFSSTSSCKSGSVSEELTESLGRLLEVVVVESAKMRLREE